MKIICFTSNEKEEVVKTRFLITITTTTIVITIMIIITITP